MIEVIGDFETTSRCDLGSTNSYKYARHESTRALCFGFEIPGYEREVWKPGEPFPFADFWPDFRLLAFNADFEFQTWNGCCVRLYGWPKLQPHQIECLQARAAYAGLPRKLEQVSRALALGPMGKDAEGHKIMLSLCKPRGGKLVGCVYQGGKFIDDAEKHEANFRYCEKDVIAEKLVARLAPPLPKFEQRLWEVHRKINERGVPVDVNLCRNAHFAVQRERIRLGQRLSYMTNGQITTPNQLQRIKDWCKEQGFPMDNMREDTVKGELQYPNIPPRVKELLTIRALCRDAAVAKYESILNHVDNDQTCKGAHVYYKAGPGRWAGAGPQFQNMRRLNENDVQRFVELADEISGALDPLPMYEKLRMTEKGVIPTLGSMVRMAVRARPGKKLVVCDYSSIEMRVLHWIADDQRTLQTIFDFDNGKGADPYKVAAAAIFSKKAADITKAERQCGKVQILGCGYMTGAEKFHAFATNNYGLDIDIQRAQEIVQLYRRSYPAVVNFWYGLGKKAVRCVEQRTEETIGPLALYMTGSTLNMRLPSGRELKYYDARVTEGNFGPEIEALDQRTALRKAVGLPILVENADQGIARDLLAHTLMQCDREGLPVVLHCHDEVVLEVDANDDESGRKLAQIMSSPPAWAKGLPVAAKSDSARRYVK